MGRHYDGVVAEVEHILLLDYLRFFGERFAGESVVLHPRVVALSMAKRTCGLGGKGIAITMTNCGAPNRDGVSSSANRGERLRMQPSLRKRLLLRVRDRT